MESFVHKKTATLAGFIQSYTKLLMTLDAVKSMNNKQKEDVYNKEIIPLKIRLDESQDLLKLSIDAKTLSVSINQCKYKFKNRKI